jgi:hypothetical protein
MEVPKLVELMDVGVPVELALAIKNAVWELVSVFLRAPEEHVVMMDVVDLPVVCALPPKLAQMAFALELPPLSAMECSVVQIVPVETVELVQTVKDVAVVSASATMTAKEGTVETQFNLPVPTPDSVLSDHVDLALMRRDGHAAVQDSAPELLLVMSQSPLWIVNQELLLSQLLLLLFLDQVSMVLSPLLPEAGVPFLLPKREVTHFQPLLVVIFLVL